MKEMAGCFRDLAAHVTGGFFERLRAFRLEVKAKLLSRYLIRCLSR